MNPSAGSGGQAVFSSCGTEELARACGTLECGNVEGCIQECGSCMPEEVCFEGRCTLPNCTSSVEECECGDLAFSLSTYQSCSLGTISGTELDGEAFISMGGQEHRVLAMDRWGSGHLIAWCDASTIGDLMLAFDAAGYLAQKAEPRIASFGNLPTCQPGFLQPISIPESVTYLGAELPVEYIGNAAKLAADWDALVFCGYHTEWNTSLASLIQAYVTEYGRGLLAAMDYLGYDIQPTDFEQMSAVTGPSGVIFNPISLDWADATANVAIECIPDLRPIIQ